MSETLTEIDEASVDFQAPVEYEAPIESGQTQDQKESADEKYKFNSIEDVIQAHANDGREWQRVGESSAGSEKLNFKTQESYYQDKQNVVLNRERDSEILDQLFDQGFAIKERVDGDKTTREIYFADAKGELSFVIDTLSSEQKQGNVEGDNESETGLFDSSLEDRATNLAGDQQDLRLSFLSEHLQAVAAESAEAVVVNADSNEESEGTVASSERVVALAVEAPQPAVEQYAAQSVELAAVTTQESVDSVASETSDAQEIQLRIEAVSQPQVSFETQRDIQEFGIGLVEEPNVVVQQVETVQLAQSVEVQTTRAEGRGQREEVSEAGTQINEVASVNAVEEGIVLVEMGDEAGETENIITVDRVDAVSAVERSVIVDLPEVKAVATEKIIVPAAAVANRVESQTSVLTMSQPEKSLGIELDAAVPNEAPSVVAEKTVAQSVITEINQQVNIANTETITVTSEDARVLTTSAEIVAVTEQSQLEQVSEGAQVESTANVVETNVEVTEDTAEESEVVSQQVVERFVIAEQPTEIVADNEPVVKAEVVTEVRESNVVEFRTTEKVVAETVVPQQETVDARVNLTEVVAQNEGDNRVVLFRRESEPVQEQPQTVEFFRTSRSEAVAPSAQEVFRSQPNSSGNSTNVIEVEEEAELEPQAISLAA